MTSMTEAPVRKRRPAKTAEPTPEAVAPAPRKRAPAPNAATRARNAANHLVELQAAELARKFSLAAMQWLDGDTAAMRQSGYHKADSFAYALTEVVLMGRNAKINPLAIAEKIKDRAKGSDNPFTAEEIARVIGVAVALLLNTSA